VAPNDTIVVADSELAIAELLSELLTDAGYHVRRASTGANAVDVILTEQPALVLLDLRHGGMSGLDVLRAVRQHGSAVPIVIMTTEPQQVLQLVAHGATACLHKPFEVDEVLRCVERSLQQRHGLANC
jgi:DNA-binding response OmpR family regulator